MANGVALNTAAMLSARLRKGLTSREIAEQYEAETGRELSHVTYTRWEKGDNSPYAKSVPVIAKILGLDVDDLVKRNLIDLPSRDNSTGERPSAA